MAKRKKTAASMTAVSEKINATINQQPVRRLGGREFVFLSHASEDVRDIEQLARLLEVCGITAWWSGQIQLGRQFRAEITERLNSALAVVVLWTPASIRSEWVISEASRAFERKVLLPIRSSNLAISDIPQPFDTLHTLTRDDVDGLVGALRELPERQVAI